MGGEHHVQALLEKLLDSSVFLGSKHPQLACTFGRKEAGDLPFILTVLPASRCHSCRGRPRFFFDGGGRLCVLAGFRTPLPHRSKKARPLAPSLCRFAQALDPPTGRLCDDATGRPINRYPQPSEKCLNFCRGLRAVSMLCDPLPRDHGIGVSHAMTKSRRREV